MEHSVTGVKGKNFSEGGNSGAFVVNDGCEVVGILFGWTEVKNVAYFTHIVDLVEDIKAVTGATTVRVWGSSEVL